MNFFENKVVWITGASSGLGEALAREFASAKAKLVLSARRENELGRVRKECSIFVPEKNIFILPLDMSRLENASAEMQKVIQQFGAIDILVNNAGVSQRSFASETPLEIDRKIMEINFFGGVALTKAVLPQMQKQKSGHIVVISSLMGKFGYYRRSAYCASKHALHGFFEVLRLEEKKNNIRVTMICPGFVKTDISVNAVTESGQPFNSEEEKHRSGMLPAKCAKKILTAVKNNRLEVVLGGMETFSVMIKRMFPSFFYRRIMNMPAG